MTHKTKQKTQASENTYICDGCGYEFKGNIAELPDDYQCPLCGRGVGHFSRKR